MNFISLFIKFNSKILKLQTKNKSIFDNLDNREMMNARSRSNPYESIGSVFFQNRAALKMANIDAVFNFMFTDPVDSYDGVSLNIFFLLRFLYEDN